jgi:uncharacterized protein
MEKVTSSARNVLITGATSGFGYEFAKLFAKDGYDLILIARNDERLNEVAAELTQQFMVGITTIDTDLFNPQAAKDVYDELKMKGVQIDILVNNAGQGQHGNFVEYDIARDIDMIQLNITAVVSLTKFFLKDMLARNEGKILQVASLSGKYPTPLMTVYAATKAFIISFTEGLNAELKDTNVTVTALLPGASDTDFFHKAEAEDSVTYKEQKLSDPSDVAKAGYEALLNGERRVVAGLKNKLYAAISSVMPDPALAASMKNQMSPSDEPDGREHITHGPSIEERNEIDRRTGNDDGDYDEHEEHVHNK